MFAVIVNTLAIIAGALLGLIARRFISKTVSDAVMVALGLCTVVIGVDGTIKGGDILLVIISICLGTAAGEALRLEDRTNSGCERLLSRFAKGEGAGARIASAFVTSCLIMNVGAMVIVGSLQAGLAEDYTMLYTKSLLDFCSGIMLAAAMGAGVLGSALFTLVFQGFIVLFSEQLAPYLDDQVISALSATGSLMILAIGLNMIGVTKLKVINYLPSLIFAPLVLAASSKLSGMF